MWVHGACRIVLHKKNGGEWDELGVVKTCLVRAGIRDTCLIRICKRVINHCRQLIYIIIICKLFYALTFKTCLFY